MKNKKIEAQEDTLVFVQEYKRIYGNDCYYNVDIFDEDKKKIGYGCLNVKNMGTEPNDEFIYDYDCNDEDERKSLADILGMDKIEQDWYNEDGQLIIDKYDDECGYAEIKHEQIVS